MNILFFHNSNVFYRMPFFESLSKKCSVIFVFTHSKVASNVYGHIADNEKNLDFDYKTVFLRPLCGVSWKVFSMTLNSKCNIVVVPPLDSFFECIESILIIIAGKIKRKKLVFFWERWEVTGRPIPLKIAASNLMKRLLARVILKAIDICIVPGKKSYEYLKSLGVQRRKISIIPDADELRLTSTSYVSRSSLNIDEDMVVILYLGRVIRRKGIVDLIKAFSLTQDCKKCMLLICGDGDYLGNCKRIASSLFLENIIFVGAVPTSLREDYYKLSDIFVLPSKLDGGVSEAWGLSLNEAMQMGLAVVASTGVGAAYDLINPSDNGFIFEEGNVQQLANILDTLIKNKNMRIQFASKAKEMIKNYSYDEMCKAFLSAAAKAAK